MGALLGELVGGGTGARVGAATGINVGEGTGGSDVGDLIGAIGDGTGLVVGSVIGDRVGDIPSVLFVDPPESCAAPEDFPPTPTPNTKAMIKAAIIARQHAGNTIRCTFLRKEDVDVSDKENAMGSSHASSSSDAFRSSMMGT